MNLYSFYDTERKSYSPIFPAEDDTIAKRQYLLSITKSPFWTKCELYWLGMFLEQPNELNPIAVGEPRKVKITDDEVNEYWNLKDAIKSDK